MFIVRRRIKRKKGMKIYYSIAETKYIDKKPKHKIIKYLGTAENILKVFNKFNKNRKK